MKTEGRNLQEIEAVVQEYVDAEYYWRYGPNCYKPAETRRFVAAEKALLKLFPRPEPLSAVSPPPTATSAKPKKRLPLKEEAPSKPRPRMGFFED